MVGGDTHTLLGDTGKLSVVPGSVPAGAYPTEVTNLDGKTVCVVQAWHYAHAVGKLSVSFDANGDVTSCSGGPVFPVADSSTYVTTPPWGQTGNPLSAEDQALVVAKLEQNHAKVTAEHADTKAWIDTNKGEITTMQVGRPIIRGKYRFVGDTDSNRISCRTKRLRPLVRTTAWLGSLPSRARKSAQDANLTCMEGPHAPWWRKAS